MFDLWADVCARASLSSLLCDRERRDIAGDKPPDLSGFCGSNVEGTFYVFAGCNNNRYTNEVLFHAAGQGHIGCPYSRTS